MACVFDDCGAALLDRLLEFPAPVMAVDTPTDLVARLKIGQGRRPHGVPRELESQRCPGYSGDHVAHYKAQFGVQAQGAGVIRRMDEADPQTTPCRNTLKYVLHEVAANRAVLQGGIDGNRPETCDRGALVEEVTSHDAPIQLRNVRIKPGLRQPTGHP